MNALRRYVVVLVITTVIGGAIAALLGLTGPSEYRATVRTFFISSAINVSDVYQATLAGVLRVNTYKVLASDEVVLTNAIREAGVKIEPAALQEKLHVDIPPGTLLMDISVDNPDPVTAANLANAVSNQLISLINEVERPLGGGPSPVGLSVIQRAVPSSDPQATLNPILVGIGATVGFVVGCGISLVLSAVRRRRKVDDHAAVSTESDDELATDETARLRLN